MKDSATTKSGTFGFPPIKSPKQTESEDGVLKKDSTTRPASANKKN